VRRIIIIIINNNNNNNNNTLCRCCSCRCRCRCCCRFSLDITFCLFVCSFPGCVEHCTHETIAQQSHTMCMTVCVTVACNVYALMCPCGVSSTSHGKSTATAAAGVCVARNHTIGIQVCIDTRCVALLCGWQIRDSCTYLHSYVRMPACLLCAMHMCVCGACGCSLAAYTDGHLLQATQ
jgi:hypothetical protein